MLEKIIEFFENKKIAILGLGKEGISTYKFIRKYLANQFITLLDQKDISDNALFKNDNNLEIIYGDKYLENLNNYDIILKSPGVVLNNINDEVKNKIYSEIEILLKYKRENVIGITGTKGKSTTSSLLYKVLKNNKKDVFILGNIGNAIFDDLDKIKNDSLLVVEMSSHQLEYVNYSPHIGIILNLFQDHLDHAGSVELYHKSKLNIFKYQNKEDYAIYELDNKYLNDYLKDPVYKAKKYCFQEEENNKLNTMYIKENNIWLNKEKIYNLNQQRKLLGMHNLKNIMAVLIVAKILNLDMNITIDTINNFEPLPYRMEFVGTYNDINYYCDTIATIPEATIFALESLKNIKTLIIGGQDRGIDYTKFIDYLNNSLIDNLICMPTTGNKIGQFINNKKVYFVDTLKDAVEISEKVTPKNMGCLLSPAAASYEYYRNFEEKGDEFKNLIKKI